MSGTEMGKRREEVEGEEEGRGRERGGSGDLVSEVSGILQHSTLVGRGPEVVLTGEMVCIITVPCSHMEQYYRSVYKCPML